MNDGKAVTAHQSTALAISGTPYDSEYYAKHCGPVPYDRSNPTWSRFFGGIAEELIRAFQPRRMFDAGCAHGFLIEAFWDRGVEAWGRDISDFAISQVRPDLQPFCAVGSIAEPINDYYDLITCIEVLEHMPEAEANAAIAAMAAATDRIVLSSSPTDFDEPTHINVRPAIYWLRRFAAQGFAPRIACDTSFITPQALVLERSIEGRREADLTACAELVRLRLMRAERDQIIRDQCARLAEAERRAAAADTNAADAEQCAAQAEAARLTMAVRLADTVSGLAETEARLTDTISRLVGTEGRLADTETRLASANIRLTDTETRLAKTQAQLADAETGAQAAAAEAAFLRAELERRAAECHAVMTSTSWRITAPLRRLRIAMRRAALAAGRGQAAAARASRQRIRLDVPQIFANPRLRRLIIGMRSSLPGRAVWGVLRRSPMVQRLARRAFTLPGHTPPQRILDDNALGGAADGPYEPPAGLLPWFNPLNIEVSAELAGCPALNVLVPSLATKNLSGGPNTAINLAYRLAAKGVTIRLISTDVPPDTDTALFWRHVRALAETGEDHPRADLVDASDRSRKLRIGINDVFMATAWWTAQMAKYAVRHTRHSRFVYLIQDYEPLLHPASTQQALAEETYGLDFLPVVNTSLLHEFLVERRIGRFTDASFAAQAIVFEPAVNTDLFHPEAAVNRTPAARRRLLFYARPTGGLRNLYELGLAALQKLIAEREIDPDAWEFIAMGEALPPAALGRGAMLVVAPWLGLDDYAAQMRSSDVLLSPMLSPHPSYPPLEMAACGRPVVTTIYANKTAERLAAISPNIIGAQATVEALAAALLKAVRQAETTMAPSGGDIGLPRTWSDSLAEAVPQLYAAVLTMLGAPPLSNDAQLHTNAEVSRLFPGYRTWPTNQYNVLRMVMLRERADLYHEPEPGLISLLTTVWNTDPAFVAELAESVFDQDAGAGFEWVILDNGTTRADTRALLAQLAAHPAVRLLRVEQNVGIIGGLRHCLEQARHRYIVPLDSDDLLTPDCLRIITSVLRRAGYPALAYTDEDKLEDRQFRDPYCKPGWDPVLFVHSCYIAHVCAIDRALALELGAYTDRNVEGSHDWDSFLRFWLAGHTPLHIPEIVYSWRMHAQSTAGNIASKDYIFSSQASVLRRFIAHLREPEQYRLELSPLFSGTPDWRIIRQQDPSPTITTIMLTPRTAVGAGAAVPASADRTASTIEELATIAADCGGNDFIHLLSTDARIEDASWAVEAMTMFAAFPDAVLVGGRLHRRGIVVAADSYFRFGAGCESPNVGRALHDPGYFAQMWKPHAADAVPVAHCVARASFLADTVRSLTGTGASLTGLGTWLAGAAIAQGRTVIYSPFLLASVTAPPPPVPLIEQSGFLMAYGQVMQRSRLLSPRIGLTVDTAYQPITRTAREAQERAAQGPHAASYADRHAAEVMARRITTMPDNESGLLSFITPVWDTEPSLLEALADSLFTQDGGPNFEWVILDNGSTREDTKVLLLRLGTHPVVRLFRAEQNLGIIAGLRLCLGHARNRYVVPVDHDDLLTPDCVRMIAAGLRAADYPPFVYSDEDVLSAAALDNPYRRPPFDPVLNDADSYVWHVCAFERAQARALGVYEDAGAEFCHDWDTISRFAEAGARIHHIPHVLYHWRVHARSSSNSGTVNRGSLESVRHMLQRVIARQATPALYEVGPCPIDRGAEQYAILRRPIAPLPMCLLRLVRPALPDEAQTEAYSRVGTAISETRVVVIGRSVVEDLAALRAALDGLRSAFVVLTGPNVTLLDGAGLWEAMRMFEMHPDMGVVSGRLVDQDGVIVASCTPMPTGPDATQDNWAGRRRTDPGDYALALKPQTAAAIPENFFVCRSDILLAAIAEGATMADDMPLGQRVTAVCRTRGMRLGYAPVFEASCVVDGNLANID